MSGCRRLRKGGRTINALKASGIAVVRVPLSGAVGGRSLAAEIAKQVA